MYPQRKKSLLKAIADVPMWIWLFIFSEERRVSVDGRYLTITTTNLFGTNTQDIPVGSRQWGKWIEENDSFIFRNINFRCLFRRERSGKYRYWYIYKWNGNVGRNEKLYVGDLSRLTSEEIIQKATIAYRMGQLTREEITARKRNSKRLRTLRKSRRQVKARARRDLGTVD